MSSLAEMQRKISASLAFDLAGQKMIGDLWIIPECQFDPKMDYCDTRRGKWIWSAGRNRQTGIIFAAADMRFLDDTTSFQNVWRR